MNTGGVRAGHAPEGTITVLFTDIERSTVLLERMGDRTWAQALAEHDRIVRAAVEAHGGLEVKSVGDGFMVAFSSAHAALLCAIAIQRSFVLPNPGAPSARTPSARARSSMGVRIGLHTGEAVIRGGDFFGKTVVLAARIAGVAHAGEILISSPMSELVASSGEFAVMGTREAQLKGLSGTYTVHAIDWRDSEGATSEGATSEGATSEGATSDPGERPAVQIRSPAPRHRTPSLPAGLALAGAFVGRVSEREWLEQRWATAREGDTTTTASPMVRADARLVVVEGEPGIGKTRLAAEVARSAHAGGALVLHGRCHEETLIPYQPFVEALQHGLAELPADQLLTELGPLGVELARIVPELGELVPDGPAPPGGAVDPDGERYRLFEAICGFLVRLAQDNPLLIVLDDIQWADQPTLLALRYFVRAAKQAPLLVLATYRTTEHLSPTSKLSETLADLRREDLVERMALSGLDLPSVVELISGGEGGAPTLEFAELVRQETEGNPFFIQQILRHLADSGATAADSGATGTDSPLSSTPTIHQLGVPEGVKEVVGRRLSALSDTTRATLGVAAVIGREFRLDVLEAVSDLDADALLDALEDALAAHLIEELTGRAGEYTFSHALVRETLYEGLSATRRARLHRRIGIAVRERRRAELTSYLAELAHHFYEAGRDGDLTDAIEYCALAGDEAVRALAYEEAVEHYRRALDALDRMPGEVMTRRCELLLALGNASWRAGFVDPAKNAYRSAAALAETLGDADALARSALGYGLGEAVVQFNVGLSDDAGVELLERALAALPDRDSGLRARVVSHLANELALTAERRRGEALADQAVAMARRLDDPATLAFVLMKTYPVLWRPADPERRLAVLREIGELAEQLGDGLRLVQAHVWAFACALELGDASAVAAEYARITEFTASERAPYASWVTALIGAMRAQLEGRLAEVEVLAQNALELGRDANTETAAQLFAVQMLLLRRDQGRLEELRPVFDDVANRYSALWAWTAGAATFYGELGERDRAIAAMDELARVGLAALPPELTWSVGMWFLAEGCWLTRDQQRATELYELLLPHRDRCAVVPHSAFVGPLAGALGALAALTKRPAEACAHFEQGIETAGRLGAAGIVANLQERYALTLIELDRPRDTARAGAIAAEARETAEALGMSALLKRLDALVLAARLQA